MGTSRSGGGGGLLGYAWGHDDSAVGANRTLGDLDHSYTDGEGIVFEEFTTTGGDTFTGISIEEDGVYSIATHFGINGFGDTEPQIRKSTTWPATTGDIDTHGDEVATGGERDYFFLWTGELTAGEKLWTWSVNGSIQGAMYEVRRLK